MDSASCRGEPDCRENSLRWLGWRQGCVFQMELPHHSVDLGPDGRPITRRDIHGEWLVASQDCDLAWTDASGGDCCIELRPLFREEPPQDWGIRSRLVLVTAETYLDALAPRLTVSPRLLAASGANHAICLLPDAARALKTWMGLRYDRPAVPGVYLDLHSKLRSQITKRSARTLAENVRDVMVRYSHSAAGTPLFELVAILPASTSPGAAEAFVHTTEIEAWLTRISIDVPVAMGVASALRVLPADRVSLAFLEEAYAVDASEVSWPRGGGGPIGAVG